MYPNLLHLGFFTLPTFGALAAIGLIAGLTLSLYTAAKLGLDREKVWSAGLFTILAAFVLSRLLLVIVNLRDFLTYLILLVMVPSLTAAGLALTIIATILYLRFRGLPALRTLDAWAPCATLVWAFLALGHFAEGSDPGLPTRVPWGIAIPPSALRLHPIALYAAIAAILITFGLLRYLSPHRHAGDTIASALVAAGVTQYLLTFLRQPCPYPVPLGNLLDPIQWIALGMIATAALISLQSRKLLIHAV